MNKFLMAVLGALLLLNACTYKIATTTNKTYAPIAYNEEVLVIGLKEQVPASAEKLGTAVTDYRDYAGGCSFDEAVAAVLLEARKMGGNAIKLLKSEAYPTNKKCHYISAEVFLLNGPYTPKIDTTEHDKEPDIVNLYLFRPRSMISEKQFELFIDNEWVGNIQNYSKYLVQLTPGNHTVVAVGEERKTVQKIFLDAEKDHYIKCGLEVDHGEEVPKLTILDQIAGPSQLNMVPDYDFIDCKNGQTICCRITDEDQDKIYFKIKREGRTIKTSLNRSKIETIRYAKK